MPDETILRAKAREAIRTGEAAVKATGPHWGGPGVGAPCSVCGEPIKQDQLELETEFAHDGSNPGLDKFHIHVRCFAVWELERRQGGAPHS
jgi:hypothetical protein